MKPKRPISDEEFRAMLLSLGLDPDEDFSDLDPQDLSASPPDQWQEFSRVTPPSPILRYLESGDTLTDHSIDCMEMAIETAYRVSPPWCITSMRDGAEKDGNLSVRYFYLLKET
jgi:hypothetical protein